MHEALYTLQAFFNYRSYQEPIVTTCYSYIYFT